VQPAPALSSPLAHTGSLARISHSSPPSPTSKTKRAPFRLPPIQPYLTYPTQINPLTHHSLTTNQPTNNHQSSETGTPPLPYLCASFIYSPFPPFPSRSPPSGGLPPNNQTHHHSQYPTSGFQHPKRKKSEAWRVVTGPQLLLHRRLHGAYADEPLTSTRLALP